MQTIQQQLDDAHARWLAEFSIPTTVTTKPTAAMEIGTYKVIDEQGLYWGTWKVCRTWTGEKTVIRSF